MNTVTLIGRWAAQLELRYTTTGKAVVNGRLAVGKGDKVAWVPVVVWEKEAENTMNYCGEKGNEVGITGYLQSREYQTQEGQKRTVLEVVATKVDFLSKNDGERSAPKAAPGMGSEPKFTDDDDVPF